MFFSLALIATSFVSGGHGGEIDPELELTKQRSSIKSGYLVVKTTYKTKAIPVPQLSVRKIWFSGKQFRVDVMKGKDAKREIYGEHCEKPDHYFSFSEKDVSTNAIPMYLGAMQAAGLKHGQAHKLDPRMIGLATIPIFALRAATIEKVLGRTDTKGRKTEAIKNGKANALSVKFTLLAPAAADCTMIFLPDSDYHLAELSVQHDQKGKSNKRLVTAAAKRWGIVWFPEKTRLQEFEDGILIAEEVNELSEVQLNTPIPASVFTLAGMDLPKNIPIRVIGTNTLHEWNGEQIVPQNFTKHKNRTEQNATSAPAPDGPNSLDFLNHWWVSTGLLLIGVCFLGRHYFRKTT